MTLRFKLSILLFITCQFAFADPIVSPFNKRVLYPDSILSSYSFITFGHWYGSQLNWRSVLPSATILSNIDSINNRRPAFVMAMGDIYRHTDSITLSHFQTLLLNKINAPLFNAVGNHEMEDSVFYKSHFGKTIYSFRIKGELYIVLDGEVAICELEGTQLDFLNKMLDSASNDQSIRNVFIFSHRLMWITVEEEFMEVFKDINNEYECFDDTTFKNQIYPTLIKLSDKKPVYWLSGDYGFTLFYHKVKGHNLSFISCSMNDSEDDALLQISISEKGNVSINPRSLTGKKLLPLESYTIDYWREHIIHMGSIDKIRLMVQHKYFWGGVAVSLIILLLGITFLRLRKSSP